MQIISRLLPFRTGGFDVSDEKRIETNMDHELTDHPQGAPAAVLVPPHGMQSKGAQSYPSLQTAGAPV